MVQLHLHKRPLVLIMEDDGLIAMDLQFLLEDFGADTCVAHNVLSGETALSDTFDFARRLCGKGVSFAFLSASNPMNVPEDLRFAPFLRKPCAAQAILHEL